MARKLSACLIRGGTSKGLFVNELDLPTDRMARDKLLLSIMGSPDPSSMQLNGIGGGISSTSKVALIKQSTRPNIDVDYLFGQVSLTEPKIDWDGSCGNLVAAVGVYAVHHGLARAGPDGSACVRVWQVNLDHEIRVNIPSATEGLISIPGVPGVGSPIYVEFIDPSGGSSLLPGNKPTHRLTLPDGNLIESTLILGANPTVIVRAVDLGLTGSELPDQIDFQKLQVIINELCMQGAEIMGITCNAAVRLAWVAGPADYTTSDGSRILKNQLTLLSRISTEGRVHHAHTGTGAINLACAAKIPGTIPFDVIRESTGDSLAAASVGIGHPLGVMHVNAKVEFNGQWTAASSGFVRTVKLIMVGEVYE